MIAIIVLSYILYLNHVPVGIELWMWFGHHVLITIILAILLA